LPEYSAQRTSDELPGWTLLVRPGEGPAPSGARGPPLATALPHPARSRKRRTAALAAETSAPSRTLVGRNVKTTSLSPAGTTPARKVSPGRRIPRGAPFTVAVQPG